MSISLSKHILNTLIRSWKRKGSQKDRVVVQEAGYGRLGRSISFQKEEPSMVTITRHCPHCQSDAPVRNGHAPHSKQLYHCRSCGRQSRENPTPHAYPEARREEILHAYQERSSLRGLTRTFGVSRTTVSSWIKKK